MALINLAHNHAANMSMTQDIFIIVSALIFYMCEGSSKPIAQLSMQKNYGINIFYYEGHDL